MIGEVTDRGKLRCFLRTAPRWATSPSRRCVDGLPRATTCPERPARLRDEPRAAPPSADPTAALRALLGSPNIASRRWITRQYDQLVGSGTVVRPGGDAGVVRLLPTAARSRCRSTATAGAHGSTRAAAAQRGVRGGPKRRLHGRPAGRRHQLPELRQPRDRRGRLRAGRGHRGHVAGLRGARPAGRLGQRVALQRAHGPADLPHAGGRRGRAARGRLAGGLCRLQGRRATRCSWPGSGRPRSTAPSIRRWCSGKVEGRIPDPDLANEACAARVPGRAAEAGCCASAHDVSDGGLAVCVAESAIAGGIGVDRRGRASCSPRARGAW